MIGTGDNFKAALFALGPIGEAAAKRLESQSLALKEHIAAREMAERQVRDMTLTVERLKRQLAEARSRA